MTKWTKGPWIVGKSQDNDIHCVDAKNDEGHTIELCEVWGTEMDTRETKESMANAHLIAAAPDLYEALEVFGRLADQLDGDAEVERTPDDEWAKFRLLASDYRRARAALAKARGES